MDPPVGTMDGPVEWVELLSERICVGGFHLRKQHEGDTWRPPPAISRSHACPQLQRMTPACRWSITPVCLSLLKPVARSVRVPLVMPARRSLGPRAAHAATSSLVRSARRSCCYTVARSARALLTMPARRSFGRAQLVMPARRSMYTRAARSASSSFIVSARRSQHPPVTRAATPSRITYVCLQRTTLARQSRILLIH
jgi:hypothetical protein